MIHFTASLTSPLAVTLTAQETGSLLKAQTLSPPLLTLQSCIRVGGMTRASGYTALTRQTLWEVGCIVVRYLIAMETCKYCMWECTPISQLVSLLWRHTLQLSITVKHFSATRCCEHIWDYLWQCLADCYLYLHWRASYLCHLEQGQCPHWYHRQDYLPTLTGCHWHQHCHLPEQVDVGLKISFLVRHLYMFCGQYNRDRWGFSWYHRWMTQSMVGQHANKAEITFEDCPIPRTINTCTFPSH